MKNNKIEYRNFELRFEDSLPESRVIGGLAIPVDSRSQLLGGQFYETISRNAVTDELIRNNDVRLLIDHEPTRGTLARSKYGEGSLRLYIEDDGLHFETELPKTALGDEILEGIRRLDYAEMSFGFYCGEDDWTENVDGTYNREIRSISKLIECSVLSQPAAYLATDVALRSLEDFKEKRAKEEEEEKEETEETEDKVENEETQDETEKEEEKSQEETEETQDEEEEKPSEDEVENEDDKKEEEERKQSILKRLEELRTEINNLTKM